MKKKDLPTKICSSCKRLLHGEKNGNLIGQMLNIVQKDALVIKLV